MKVNYFSSVLDLFFPRCCILCGRRLSVDEEYVCTGCLSGLPLTDCHLEKDNQIEQRFWGKFSIERATSYFYYMQGGDTRTLLFELKYHHCKEIGEVFGRYMAKDIFPSGFFDGIDLIIPVPLHPLKLKERGYNQSEWIAKGISHVTKIPIDLNCLKRIVANTTQTHKSVFERWENVQGIFTVIETSSLQGKHILLVDDVLTTGATLGGCAQTLIESVNDVKISVLTLAVT